MSFALQLSQCMGIEFEMTPSYVMGSWDGEMVKCNGL
jgi:hypothetical protein